MRLEVLGRGDFEFLVERVSESDLHVALRNRFPLEVALVEKQVPGAEACVPQDAADAVVEHDYPRGLYRGRFCNFVSQVDLSELHDLGV